MCSILLVFSRDDTVNVLFGCFLFCCFYICLLPTHVWMITVASTCQVPLSFEIRLALVISCHPSSSSSSSSPPPSENPNQLPSPCLCPWVSCVVSFHFSPASPHLNVFVMLCCEYVNVRVSLLLSVCLLFVLSWYCSSEHTFTVWISKGIHKSPARPQWVFTMALILKLDHFESHKII